MPILCTLPLLPATNQFKYRAECTHFFYVAGPLASCLSFVSVRAHFVYSALSANKSVQIQGGVHALLFHVVGPLASCLSFLSVRAHFVYSAPSANNNSVQIQGGVLAFLWKYKYIYIHDAPGLG